MKVLISAYACEPGAGSEPGAGWTWARAAALDHDVWVLTRENNAPAIQAALEAEPHLRMHPVYLDLPKWARFWKKGQRGVHLYYVLWQVLARRTAKRLHAKERFNVAHHLTLAVDWMPAGVVGIDGLPAVWGPVGGSSRLPWRLWKWLGARGLMSEAAREVLTRPARRIFGDRTARRAALIVAQNRDVDRRFRPHGQVVVEPNVAIGELNPGATRSIPQGEPAGRVAVYAGRLIAWKGVPLAVAALAEPEARDWSLHLYGDGPDRGRLRRLCSGLGIGDRVVLHGHRSRSEVLAAIASADAFIFPSLHDAAGWAVAEAVSLGTPVVCLDVGGPPCLLIEGFAVSPTLPVIERVLARSLQSCVARAAPSGRWSDTRLPDILDRWYAECIREEAVLTVPHGVDDAPGGVCNTE